MTGEELYRSECILCHGTKGNLGKANSLNLQQSELDTAQIFHVIKYGRAEMPPFDYLSNKAIKALSLYMLELRKN